ncbi:class I SAM-dependent methyltransferase [Cellulomonas sp.]|uniref:class I SAM-dependent methyltransferase n=1 Tax=Cellulomonas sp. TaxID=40001 RepID=UPI003BACA1F0
MAAVPEDEGRTTTPPPTAGPDYAERLARLESARWKQLLDVQAPYRRHVQRLRLGRTVDVGCGIGRNLESLDPGSVGVDHNPHSVQVARSRGLDAWTDEQFFADPVLSAPESFDGLLAAHLVEHLPADQILDVVQPYVSVLAPGGRAAFITPMERGYASDATHVRFSDFPVLTELCAQLGLEVRRTYSFPFPRWTGRLFTYNEFVVLATKPAA